MVTSTPVVMMTQHVAADVSSPTTTAAPSNNEHLSVTGGGGITTNTGHHMAANSNSPCGSSSATVVFSPAKLREDEKRIQMVICDLNVQIATFRDLLIHVGTAKDAPELREKIRRVRRQCVEACKQTHTTLMPQIKSALAEGTILDNHQLICLFMLSQLLERELNKCLRLVVAIPMDMTSFYDVLMEPYPVQKAQQKGHGLSNVLSKIVLGTTVRPDFNIEEKASIEKDSREMKQIIREMADYLPKEDPVKARHGLTNNDSSRGRWMFKKKKSERYRPNRNSNNGAAANSNGAGNNTNLNSATNSDDNERNCMLNHVSNSFCCLCSTPNYV